MKATLRLMIAAAVMVSAQMSFASTDTGASKPGCPYAHVPGTLVATDYSPHPAPARPVVPAGQTAQ